jgi:23S rRNA (uracil1939-C5)-methyltransferase
VEDQRFRPGDAFEAVCTAMDDTGSGVAQVADAGEQLRIHIAGALPGERVRVRLDHVSAHRRGDEREAWASLLDVLAPSADRVGALCPAYGACGGCTLMQLAYPAQLAWKRERVLGQFASYPALAALTVDACLPSAQSLGYRNQAKYVYGHAHASGRVVLGAYAPRSHDLVDLAGCQVVEPVLDDARQALLAALIENVVEPFDEILRTGVLRYAVLRATAAGQVMATLVSARAEWPAAEAVAVALCQRCPAVNSVILNVNAGAGNALFGEAERVLVGRASVEDTLGDVRVRLSSRSFFQANRQVASQIYRAIVAAAPNGVSRAVDVYAGACGIALSLVSKAGEVVAIEDNSAATRAATDFLAQQGADAARMRVVTGDAARCLADINDAGFVVLNPPRKGCGAEVLAAVARLRPQLFAYLSCDPRTLARDLAVLVVAGAQVVQVTPFDMMPHTPHVETLALVRFL